jgi:hypothetical protein
LKFRPRLLLFCFHARFNFRTRTVICV